MAIVEVQNLKKSFNNLNVLNGVSFSMEKGEVLAIIGPSGSGKSTLLRCIAHLEIADFGSIKIDDDYLCKDGVYPGDSKLRDLCLKTGMVFQQFNLFPHMSVRQNLTIAPTTLKKAFTEKDVDALLEKVDLLDKKNVLPNTLSGGQKQRVAIARALMLNPKIMLFDEPTSALDPELTKEVLRVIKQLANEHCTMIIVTHEIEFAKEAANRIIFMDGGNIVDLGSKDTWNNHDDARIRSFLN